MLRGWGPLWPEPCLRISGEKGLGGLGQREKSREEIGDNGKVTGCDSGQRGDFLIVVILPASVTPYMKGEMDDVIIKGNIYRGEILQEARRGEFQSMRAGGRGEDSCRAGGGQVTWVDAGEGGWWALSPLPPSPATCQGARVSC